MQLRADPRTDHQGARWLDIRIRFWTGDLDKDGSGLGKEAHKMVTRPPVLLSVPYGQDPPRIHARVAVTLGKHFVTIEVTVLGHSTRHTVRVVAAYAPTSLREACRTKPTDAHTRGQGRHPF
jgi:hypothetical protein